ncbi:site-specific integrase [Asticcacaulis sp. BYS171W]|uniref:Site-specific integrase n=1 Tax=Asticcacaulis aquaticus TaxID=2984212 RepID=A0ABT5HT47_9CAUL|nr:site-specific integrase [Asticcacaulis aquaticus]MDC7683232.1 site-specific integrase [Asticcacaulis aquaticus]
MPDYVLAKISTSKYWYITWTEGRRSRRASTRQTDRREAEKVLAAFSLEYNPDAPAILTAIDVLDWYYDTHGKDLHRADSTKDSVEILKAFFSITPAHEIDPQKQAEFIAHRRIPRDKNRTEPLSNDTINRDLATLSAALRKAFEWKLIEQPFKVTLLPKPAARERFLTRHEVAKLYRQLRQKRKDNKDYKHVLLFARIALNTGARPGAILTLTWDRVDFSRRILWFPVPGRAQTNKRAAVISFDHKLEAALLRAKKAHDELARKSNQYPNEVIVFEGQPVKVIRKSVTTAMKAVGITDASPHTFRHTFATWAAMGGAPLYILGGALGHSNPSTTAKYAKYQPEAFKDVIRASRKKRSA